MCVAYDDRTALLSMEADVNVLPSRYLFSPLILCFILRSNSSESSESGESDACYIEFTLETLVLEIQSLFIGLKHTMTHPHVSA